VIFQLVNKKINTINASNCCLLLQSKWHWEVRTNVIQLLNYFTHVYTFVLHYDRDNFPLTWNSIIILLRMAKLDKSTCKSTWNEYTLHFNDVTYWITYWISFANMCRSYFDYDYLLCVCTFNIYILFYSCIYCLLLVTIYIYIYCF